MNSIQYVERLKSIEDWLTDSQSDCTPDLIAKKWNVSERAARHWINELKGQLRNKDKTIVYNRKSKSYEIVGITGKEREKVNINGH